ncbi:hypothetical protein Syun_013613 [Stephania yunnanensis]|uniref:Uncharacterized protein n=1 Tax=Stephania yunnanensis TaxID=152371 RepID=A0AAP0JJH0_9MAGN
MGSTEKVGLGTDEMESAEKGGMSMDADSADPEYWSLSLVSRFRPSRSRWSPFLRLVVLPGLSAVSGLAVSLVSPSRRSGLRHRRYLSLSLVSDSDPATLMIKSSSVAVASFAKNLRLSGLQVSEVGVVGIVEVVSLVGVMEALGAVA